jgi:hypothetical protein
MEDKYCHGIPTHIWQIDTADSNNHVRITIFTTWATGYAGAEPSKHASYITDGRGRRDRPAYTQASGASTKREGKP